MTSWTYSTSTIGIVVTADNVDLALEMIESALFNQHINPIEIKREELIPLPRHRRYVIILYNRDNDIGAEVQE